jgi:hypothetical protein
LDLSTVDFTQPISVGLITLAEVHTDTTALFSKKYTTDGIVLSKDITLKALCGTAAANLELIEELFKAKTGIDIQLNGDDFLRDLENGVTTHIVEQQDKYAYADRVYYQWRAKDHENPEAMIQLIDHKGTLIPLRVTIDNHDMLDTTISQAHVDFVNVYSDKECDELAARVKQVAIR